MVPAGGLSPESGRGNPPAAASLSPARTPPGSGALGPGQGEPSPSPLPRAGPHLPGVDETRCPSCAHTCACLQVAGVFVIHPGNGRDNGGGSFHTTEGTQTPGPHAVGSSCPARCGLQTAGWEAGQSCPVLSGEGPGTGGGKARLRSGGVGSCGPGTVLDLDCGDYTAASVNTHVSVRWKRLDFIVGKFYPNKNFRWTSTSVSDDTKTNALTRERAHVEELGGWVAWDRHPCAGETARPTGSGTGRSNADFGGRRNEGRR